jgi:hypothetical protein
VEDIQMGISKPLQEIVLSSSDEEYANMSGYSKNPNEGSFTSNLNDEDDEEDDEEDDDEDDV